MKHQHKILDKSFETNKIEARVEYFFDFKFQKFK